MTSVPRLCTFIVLLLLAVPTGPTQAQEMDGQQLKRMLPPDTAITQTDRVTVKDEEIPYEVTAGTQPVYGEDDSAVAALHYTYYRRTDVEDRTRRPLFVSFNGGPGSLALDASRVHESQASQD